jgi:ParB family chromosome partitioning protein
VRVLDPNVREAQRSLEGALGVKVEIVDRKGRGKIILKYGSLEDFDRIVEALGAR